VPCDLFGKRTARKFRTPAETPGTAGLNPTENFGETIDSM